MDSLINMQMSKEEAKEYTQPEVSDAPKYPWGLCLNLNDDSIEKLGITKLPAIETEVTIIAKATVASTRESQTQGGDTERSLELQITDMQISGADTDLLGRAQDKLYNKAKE